MSADKRTAVVVGSINMNLVAYAKRIPVEGETIIGTNFQTHPGGKGANQAAAAARLGATVSLIGRLGDDAFGTLLKQHLEDARVIATSPGTSGIAVILVSEAGENCIVITPGATALLTPADLEANVETLRNARVVLTQLEIPIRTVQHLAEICAREKVPLILDPAPAQQLPDRLLRDVAWFTPNETEAGFFTGTDFGNAQEPALTAEILLRQGARGVVLKLGARGASLANGSEAGTLLHPFRVAALDTTAAGDTFNGAFAAGLVTHKSAIESARFATAAAALSVTCAGAQPSMPSLAEVEEMLADAVTKALQSHTIPIDLMAETHETEYPN